MSEIHCQPDDRRIPTNEDATLLALLVESGVSIARACGGQGRCSTCRVRIEEGLTQLDVRNALETRMAERLELPDEIRLACQIKPCGPLRVRRLVLDDRDVSLASQFENPEAGGVGREERVAVLFLDVEGFTSLSEALPAYDVVHVLNRFLEEAGDRIERRRGTISNYTGDGLMALFDAPDTDCADALDAGLDLAQAAADVDAYVRDLYGRPFAIRIGVHYGEAVVGHVGHRGSRRETAIGDTVNLASRIEAANKETGTRFLASAAVRARCADRFEFGRDFEVTLRGRSGAFQVHEVVGRS